MISDGQENNNIKEKFGIESKCVTLGYVRDNLVRMV